MQLGKSPSMYVQHPQYGIGGRGVWRGGEVGCSPILGVCGERETLFYKNFVEIINILPHK